MVSFLKRYRLIITSVFLCLFALHTASTNIKGIGGTAITGRLVFLVTVPVQSGIIYVVEGINGAWSSYLYLVNVKKENYSLKSDIAKLKEENNRLKEESLLNNRLRELLAFKETAAATAVEANVIGIEGAGWTRTVSINKGSSDGISRDMAVITPSGIVGRIIDAQPAASKALLLTDPRSSIDVIVQRNRIKGIVEGNVSNSLTLKYIRHGEDIQIGDVLVSSGLSGMFPKGLIVGEVTRIEKGEDNFFIGIEVKPGANLQKLEEVLIMKNDIAISSLPDRTQ